MKSTESFYRLRGIAEKRINKLTSALRNILQTNQEYMRVKDLASVVGQVISLEMAVGNVVSLMPRSAYSLINSCRFLA